MRLLKVFLLAAGVLAAGFFFSRSTSSSACSITLDEFSRLQPGDSYNAVIAIVGCEGTVLSKSYLGGHATVMIGWNGAGTFGANSNVMFQDDALISKAQFGLN